MLPNDTVPWIRGKLCQLAPASHEAKPGPVSESSRRSSSHAPCEQFDGGKPEHKHCERYRIVFEHNTHDTLHIAKRRTPIGCRRWLLNHLQVK
jgi:hypothetical protein